KVLRHERDAGGLTVWVDSTCSSDDIEAVCCFIVDADQLDVRRAPLPAQAGAPAPAEPAAAGQAAVAPAPAPGAASPAAAPAQRQARAPAAAHVDKESTSIRVGVEKVDQVINLVG